MALPVSFLCINARFAMREPTVPLVVDNTLTIIIYMGRRSVNDGRSKGKEITTGKAGEEYKKKSGHRCQCTIRNYSLLCNNM